MWSIAPALALSLLALPVLTRPLALRGDLLSKSYKDLPKPILSPYYMYFGNKDTPSLAAAREKLGMDAAYVGFVTALEGKCEVTTDLDQLEKDGIVKDFIAEGGAVSLTFGGCLTEPCQSGHPNMSQHVQQACTDEDDLVKLIQNSMSKFNTHNVDFDIEDPDLTKDMDAAKRLANALIKVKASTPDLFVSYTVGTLPDGMPANERAWIQAAKDAKLDLDGVALMTMNMAAPGADNVDLSQKAIISAAKQVSEVFGISIEDATKKMGMTPAIGVDNQNNVVDLAGAKTLAEFSKKNQLFAQSYWNFNRDFPGGDPSKGQDFTTSSSPDQKEPLEFFKTIHEALTASDSPSAANIADEAAKLPSNAPAPVSNLDVTQNKATLPPVDEANGGAPGQRTGLIPS